MTTTPTPAAVTADDLLDLARAYYLRALVELGTAGQDPADYLDGDLGIERFEHLDPEYALWAALRIGMAYGMTTAATLLTDPAELPKERANALEDLEPGSFWMQRAFPAGADGTARTAADRAVLRDLDPTLPRPVADTAVVLISDGMPVTDALAAAKALA